MYCPNSGGVVGVDAAYCGLCRSSSLYGSEPSREREDTCRRCGGSGKLTQESSGVPFCCPSCYGTGCALD